MNTDRLTTILGGMTGIAVSMAGGLIRMPETQQDWLVLIATLFLSATGYYTNKGQNGG